jgi:hypothetical protein
MLISQIKVSLVISGMLVLLACMAKSPNTPDPKIMTLPMFNLTSVNNEIINTGYTPEGKSTILFYFNTDCKYSQYQTETIIKNMNSFQNVHFYMFTSQPLDVLNTFYNRYNLGNYKNFTVGRDNSRFFEKTFMANSFPWLVIYDKQKKLKKVITGSIDAKSLKELTPD